jgi:uncharacterized DUF497 family protein
VWFEEARQVFDDPSAIMYPDEQHSSLKEERFLLLGLSSFAKVLVVIYCERSMGKTIRIISARKATTREAIKYEEGI